ncbi:MAG: hypothetical protein LPJ89_03095, partial [Hymenobacteraceae bacterium]|nr:hypothetical protein [Hymenobacteraceae bacterium]MDX5394969.1 hypothetical protein [Hymenobacteraceae bacterium]MDX5442751.1 hypothetical protein [Hymenobacteraceae bacterium]MDX5511003.1 hypothetical protein [Hymenobacteraceae bacterium]
VTGKGWKLLRKSLIVDVKQADLYLRNLPYAKYIAVPALRPAISNALMVCSLILLLPIPFSLTSTFWLPGSSRWQ